MKQQRKVDVITEMLDYDYIEQCNDVSVIRAIYENLLRNEHGKFVDLENAAKMKLRALLNTGQGEVVAAAAVKNAAMASQEEDREKIALQNWIDGKKENDSKWHYEERKQQSRPPVRQTQPAAPRINDDTLKDKADSSTPISSGLKSKQIFRKENMSNREYFEAWEKFDADAEAADDDEEQTKQKEVAKSDLSSVKFEREDELNNEFHVEERKFLSDKEKEKGNELFRVGQIEDSLQCYTKSVLLDDKNAKSFANRALAKMKSNPPDLQGAIDDCTTALEIDSNYIKAYVRRGTLLDKLSRHDAAVKDFEAADKLDANGGYNRLAQKSREKLEAQSEKKLSQNSIQIVEVDSTGDDELVHDEDDFDYIKEIYTPGAIEWSQSQPAKAAPKSTSGFATNLKKFFSTKTGSSTVTGSYNDASTDNEKWCRVNIVDATTEESDSTTATSVEQIDILNLEVEDRKKKTNYDGHTLCF